MKVTKYIIGLLCYSFFFSSCLTTRHTNLLVDDGNPRVETNEKNALDEYRVCAGDELRISILSLNPETNTLFSIFSPSILISQSQDHASSGLSSFTVHPDGTIDFPYLGALPVKGKTTLEIKLMLEKELEVITKDCSVQVSMNNRYFSVIGESRAGRYPIMKERTTIHQALAQAYDILPFGDRSEVKVIRQTETGTVIQVFDVRTQHILDSEFYYIQPNDVIYIPPMGRQFWGISSFGALFAVFSTITSVGLLVFKFVK